MENLFIGIFAVLAGAYGASLASFMAVVIERRRTGESIKGRSHCACGRQLRGSENIPVLGWLRARGRASCCGSRIPRHYFLSEVGAFSVFAFVTWACLHFSFGSSILGVVTGVTLCHLYLFFTWRHIHGALA